MYRRKLDCGAGNPWSLYVGMPALVSMSMKSSKSVKTNVGDLRHQSPSHVQACAVGRAALAPPQHSQLVEEKH